ncbi:MAG TPA: hypothetical protein VF552_05840 [Allosphingosinicella sp.]
MQTPAEALAEDAADYARRHNVAADEAARRLRAQEASVAAVESIRARYGRRIAGVAIEHSPEWRIVVLLTGRRRVADRNVLVDGVSVPIVFRTRAAASEAQLLRAMTEHRAAIQGALPRFTGMGIDPRTGELVVAVRGTRADPADAERVSRLAGVPVRLRAIDGPDADAGIEGGGRVEGVEPVSGRRQFCTTGFVVTDGARTGVVTAAHCPDSLTYYDPETGGEVPLSFVGGWGAQYQDVQVHVGEAPHRPVFYADSRKRSLRPLTGARSRAAIRGGETVCHRGEATGYSCAEVELTHFAPPGDLCGGPCDPVWVTVAGPSCRGGDSGGPVFAGTTAFGILKGSSYRTSGGCNYYYFMSVDFLPDGWTLLREPAAATGTRREPALR